MKLKHGDNFINYGLQNMAFDFAYSKEKDFRSIGWGHVDLFVWGGLSGAYEIIASDRDYASFGTSLPYQGIVWSVNGLIETNYQAVKETGSQLNKSVLSYFKWNMYRIR